MKKNDRFIWKQLFTIYDRLYHQIMINCGGVEKLLYVCLLFRFWYCILRTFELMLKAQNVLKRDL